MLVVTANIHAGVDGHGRATKALSEVIDLAPELLFVQELWRGDVEDQFTTICNELGVQGEFVELSPCVRVTGERGGRGWHPIHGLFTGDRGLYFSTHQTLTPARIARRDAAHGAETGSWGVGLFTKLPVHSLNSEYLPQLRADKTRRALIILESELDGVRFTAVAIHGAHLTDGSLKQYRYVAKRLDELSATKPVVLAGDFNCWRPLLRTVLPKWRSALRARTWPAWRPHSQIDHVLLRGPWRVTAARCIKNESDHRALEVELTLN